MTDRAAIILVGGLSRRFGQDKASAVLLGKPVLQHVIDSFEGVVDEYVIVKRQGQKLPGTNGPVLRVVTDAVEDAGPLAGLLQGLQCMESPVAVAVACDMPLLQPALLQRLLTLVLQHAAVVPVSDAGLAQPLCAAYSKSCIPALSRSVAAGQRRLTEAVDALRPLYLQPAVWRGQDPQGLSFTNMNYQTDRDVIDTVLQSLSVFKEEEHVHQAFTVQTFRPSP